MQQETSSTTITRRHILADRPFLVLLTAISLIALIYIIFVIATTQPSSVQIHTQCSGIGEAHFYKTQWYYLYNFAAFALIMAITNVFLAARLYMHQRRDFAFGLGYLTLVVMAITISYTQSVMQLAHI